MPKRVRRNVFCDTGLFCQVFYNIEYHYPAEAFAELAEEKYIIAAFLHRTMYPYSIPVDSNILYRISAYGYQPLLIAFANYAYKTNIKVQAANFKVPHFA